MDWGKGYDDYDGKQDQQGLPPTRQKGGVQAPLHVLVLEEAEMDEYDGRKQLKLSWRVPDFYNWHVFDTLTVLRPKAEIDADSLLTAEQKQKIHRAQNSTKHRINTLKEIVGGDPWDLIKGAAGFKVAAATYNDGKGFARVREYLPATAASPAAPGSTAATPF